MPRLHAAPRSRRVPAIAAAAVILASGGTAVIATVTNGQPPAVTASGNPAGNAPAGNRAGAGGGAQAAPVPLTACTVEYRVNQWDSGFTTNIKLTADGDLRDWEATWEFKGDQKVTSAWNGQADQSGNTVTFGGAEHNRVIPAGGSTEFGLQGTSAKKGSAVPDDFTLDGVRCRTRAAGQDGVTPAAFKVGNQPTAQPADCTGAIICDGFEDQAGGAPSGAWEMAFPNCQGTGTATVDTAVANSGTKSIRVDGGGGYCNHVFVKSTTPLTGGNLFGRYYVRHTTLLPPLHVTFMAMRDENDGGKDLRMGGQNSALQWNRESDDATLPEQSPTGVAASVPLPVNEWQCVEFQVDGAAGHIRTWLNGEEIAGLVVDGTPTADVDRQWMNKANWRPNVTDLRLGWESYGSDPDTLWYDDVAVSATRIGC